MAQQEDSSDCKILTLEECVDYVKHLFNTLPVIMRISPPEGEEGTEEEWSRRFAAITPGNVFVTTSVPAAPVVHKPRDYPGSCVGVGCALPLPPTEEAVDVFPTNVPTADINSFFEKLTMKMVVRNISCGVPRQPGDISAAMDSLPLQTSGSSDHSAASASTSQSSSVVSHQSSKFQPVQGKGDVDFNCVECGSNPVKRACDVLSKAKTSHTKDARKRKSALVHAREKIARQSKNFFLYYLQCGHAFCKSCAEIVDLEKLERCKVSSCCARIECVVPSKILMDKCTSQLYIRVIISAVLDTPDSDIFKCPLGVNCSLKSYCIFTHPKRRQQQEEALGAAALLPENPGHSSTSTSRRAALRSYQSTKVIDTGLMSVHLLEFVDGCPQPQPLVLQHVPSTFSSSSGVRITDRIINSIPADRNVEWILQFLKYYVGNPVQVALNPDLIGVSDTAAPGLLSFGFIMDSQLIKPPSIQDYFSYLRQVRARLNLSEVELGLTPKIIDWLFATRCLSPPSG